MSDPVLALLFTAAFFALLGAWVPMLDFLQRRWQERGARQLRARNLTLRHTP